MRKTCQNCFHFHSCLSEENSWYHIHNYCDKHGKTLGFLMEHPLTRFLDSHWLDMCEANSDHDGIYDDIECGLAGCYLFMAKDEINEEMMIIAFEKNRKLALNTIDHIIRQKCCHMNNELVDVDEEDAEELLKLREEFEEMEF